MGAGGGVAERTPWSLVLCCCGLPTAFPGYVGHSDVERAPLLHHPRYKVYKLVNSMFGVKGLITSAVILMVFVFFEGCYSVKVYNMMQLHTEKPSIRDHSSTYRSNSLREQIAINKERILKDKSNKVIKTTNNNSKKATKGRSISDESKPIQVDEQTGTEASLPCNISNLQLQNNTKLKWVKISDKNSNKTAISGTLTEAVLSYVESKSVAKWEWNDNTITNDKRFKSEMDKNGQTWWLHIRYTQNADEGLYQCQIYLNDPERFNSTVNVRLELVEAYAEIIGDSVICINGMKPLRLSCVLKNSTEAPDYIFWYKDNSVINWDLGDNAHVREGDKGSELIFAKPNESNSGNYTCVPSNARQASVYIKYEVDLPSSCELPENIAHAGGSFRKSLRGGGDIVTMLALISTFQLCR